MIARLTFASVALAILTIPALLAPVQAFEGPTATVHVDVIVLQDPTVTATGLAQATLVNTTTHQPVVGELVHVTIAWGPAPGAAKSSIVQQIAVRTNANGVATFSIPLDNSVAKLNFPGRHVLTAFLDGTSATNDTAYQVGTGLA